MDNGKHEAEGSKRDHFLSNQLYNIIKFLAQIFLPAVGTLYFALAAIWSLPHPEQVIGSITAVDTFLGVLLSASTSSYNKSESKYDGVINIEDNEDGPKVYSLDLNEIDPYEIDKRKEILFKVNPQ